MKNCLDLEIRGGSGEKIALEDGHDLTKTAMLKHRIYTQLDK